MKITYTANDGTNFNTEEECLAYENRYANLNTNLIRLLDEDYRPFEFQDEEWVLSEAHVVFLATDEVAELFCNMNMEYGYIYEGIEGRGTYIYRGNRWYLIEDEIRRHEEEAAKLLELKQQVEESKDW